MSEYGSPAYRLPLAEIERMRAEHVPSRAGYCFAPLCAQPSPCDAARLIAELDRRSALDVAPVEYLVANH